MSASEFFQMYFDLEWDAHVAHATNPDMDAANQVSAKLNAHRRAGVKPDYDRTEWDELDELEDEMLGAEHRTIWGIALHRGGGLAVAYTSDVKNNLTDSFAMRFAAEQKGGRWMVSALQYLCTACEPGEPCSKCGGSGWSEWFGEDPGNIGPADEFARTTEPTRWSVEGIEHLEKNHGNWS